MKTTFVLFWISMIVWITPVWSQQPEEIILQEIPAERTTDFYHLKFGGGNEQNSITWMLQDSMGQMWIATKNGLIRYNGKEKHIYMPDPDNPHSIGFHFVRTLYLDKFNRLWVGTEKGMYLYRPETDDFEARPKALQHRYITHISGDKDGNLWICNVNKNLFYRYNPATDSLQIKLRFPVQRGASTPLMLKSLITDDNRFFIIGSLYGFLIYHPEDNTYEHIRLLNDEDFKKAPRKLPNYLTNIIQDAFHPMILWIGTNLGFVIRYDLTTGKQQRLVYNTRLSNQGNTCYNIGLYMDSKDNLWITTWFYGTYKVLPGRRKMVHYLPSPTRPNGISNTITTAIYQDKAGYMWFGTEYQGIDILRKNKKFHVFPTYPNEPGLLPSAEYLSIAKDHKNRIWVGSEGNIFQVNPRTIEAVKANKLFPGANRFFDIYPDNKDRLWVATENGVYCLDSTDRLVYHLVYEKGNYQSLSSRYISEIAQDKEDNMWFGTFWHGVVKFDPHKHKYYRFAPDSLDPKSISQGQIFKIFVTPSGQVWVGTFDGLNLFNPQTGNFSIFRHDPSDTTSIGSSVINDMTFANGHLWISTQGGGLNEYLPEKKRFKIYSKRDGLPDNNILALQTDHHDNIWFTTSHHIVKFDPKTGKTKVYDASDGLENRIYVHNMGWQDLTFDSDISYKDEDGYLYFGGHGGLLFFHPDSLPVNTYHAPLYIEKFKVNGKPYPLYSHNITLGPDQNQIEADFILMNLIQPEKNRYRWKLEPFDTIWHEGDYLAHARYFNLPHGRYVLRYKAANNDGVWTEASSPLFIWIKPHFYQSANFYVVLFLIALFLTMGLILYHWYVKRQLEKKRRKMRYSWSKLEPDEAERINRRLEEFMRSGNIYLEPDLSLNKLASILGEKPNYLSQIINQFHHQNFSEYINSYRIKQAKRLLRVTALKIEAVAYDSGFNSLSTFHSAFKKETGMTPSAYRKKFREKK